MKVPRSLRSLQGVGASSIAPSPGHFWLNTRLVKHKASTKQRARHASQRSLPPLAPHYSFTARSVISSPLSMMANASRICCSLMHNGGLVKKVFQRTNV